MANPVEQSCLPQFVLKMARVLEWEVDEGGETHRKRHQSKNHYSVSQTSSIPLVVLTCHVDSRQPRGKGREKNQPVHGKVGEVRMGRAPTLLNPPEGAEGVSKTQGAGGRYTGKGLEVHV